MSNKSRPEDLADALLSAATKAGAEAADAVVMDVDSLSVEVLKGKLEHAQRAELLEVGLRVLIGQKQAIISASDARPETLTALAERAVAMAGVAPDDPHIGLADPSLFAKNTDMSVLELADATEAAAEMLQEKALAAEAAAAEVRGVSQVQTSSADWNGTKVYFATSNGFGAGFAITGWGNGAVAISGEGLGMERDYCFEERVFHEDLPPAAEIGRKAGERAVEISGAVRPPTGSFPVLFDERVSSGLIGHLMAAINGSSVARGSSWLKDAMGEAVLPKGLDLVADPHRKRISASRLFDGEGLAPEEHYFVKDGVLQSWVLDLGTGRKLGLPSNGHATRSAGSMPHPGSGNLYLTHGSASREDLMGQMGEGLLVTSMIGSTINQTTGDYSRGASGFWIKNGEISHPVNECTIAGNLRDMLGRIIPANDGRQELSRVVPSLLVEGMTIAGE